MDTTELLKDLKKNDPRDHVRDILNELIANEIVNLMDTMGAKTAKRSPERVRNLLIKYTAEDITKFLQFTRELQRSLVQTGMRPADGK